MPAIRTYPHPLMMRDLVLLISPVTMRGARAWERLQGPRHYKVRTGNFGNEPSWNPVSLTTTSYNCCTRSLLTVSNP